MRDTTHRSLLAIVFALIVMHVVLLAALWMLVMRVTVISITLPERPPAKPAAALSLSPVNPGGIKDGYAWLTSAGVSLDWRPRSNRRAERAKG